MSRLLVVFGATGQQGGSVIDSVLNDPKLSKEYKIRALTRDPAKSGDALRARGVEVVRADFDDQDSLKSALQGAHTVFSMTATLYTPTGAADAEINQGKTIADLAVAANVQHYILSTVPSFSANSNQKYTKCYIMDVKAVIEEYVRSLPLKSSFFSPGSFMQNYIGMAKPKPIGNDTFLLANISNPSTRLPLVDVSETGKYVLPLLTDPDKYVGKTICAASDILTFEEMARVMSKASGKTVAYKQVPEEVSKGFLPLHVQEPYVELWKTNEEFGYFGGEQEELLRWGREQVKGELATFEGFLERNPLKLE